MLNNNAASQINGQVTLMSFFRLPPGKYHWGLMQMVFTQHRLKGTQGLIFHKILGTGGGAGYSFKPDFETFALLTVWETRDLADEFEAKSEVMKSYRDRAIEVYSIFLSPIRARGQWANTQPFQPQKADPNNNLLIVLTRATLKPRYYYQFWKRVKGVSKSHVGVPGLIFSKGVGERPWIMQATFSAWRSEEEMAAFAYAKGGKHYEAIKTTRRMNGFKEELYARFQPLETRGSWRWKDPIGDALKEACEEKEQVLLSAIGK